MRKILAAQIVMVMLCMCALGMAGVGHAYGVLPFNFSWFVAGETSATCVALLELQGIGSLFGALARRWEV